MTFGTLNRSIKRLTIDAKNISRRFFCVIKDWILISNHIRHLFLLIRTHVRVLCQRKKRDGMGKKQWRRRLLSFYRLEKWVVSEAKLIERKNSWMTSLVNKKSYFIFC